MKKTQLLFIFILFCFVSQGQSTYEEKFNIPEYDANNPEHFLISKVADWNHINDTDKRFFYVKPGNYIKAGNNFGRIVITADGTANAKRYISLYNGNNTHPGKLDISELAIAAFELSSADYWIIDRMACWGKDIYPVVYMYSSSHNIINRLLIKEQNGSGVYLRPGSHNNTIQNCRFERYEFRIYADNAAFGLFNAGKDNISIKNTKILNNEVVNYVTGFKSLKSNNKEEKNINYEGTIVDYNHFYITKDIYSDGAGNHITNGLRAYAKNGIELQAGSENPDNPMIISNNKMWGFRRADKTGSGFSGQGTAFAVLYGVKNIKIKNNLIWNSMSGLMVAARRNGFAIKNAEITQNVIYKMFSYGFLIDFSHNLVINDNLVKDTKSYEFDGGFYTGFFYIDENLTYKNNLMIKNKGADGARLSLCTNVTISNNKYYKSLPGQLSHTSDSIYTSDPTASFADLVFITDRFTNTPRELKVRKIGDRISSKEVATSSSIIKLKENVNKFTLYPNPSNGLVNIILNKTYNNVKIEVMDISGSLVTKKSYENLDKLTLQVNALPGVYFVQITSSSEIIGSTKLVIQ